MLYHTFLHLPGVGRVTERRLWERGVTTWDEYERAFRTQGELFPRLRSAQSTLDASRAALVASDASFFTERLPSRELYRIALSFPERVLFLDIETTGLSHVYDRLTVLGWRYRGEYGADVGGDVSGRFREVLRDARVLVTFNGIRFDVPFLRYQHPDLDFPTCHVDLRYLVRQVGLSGGQKGVEQDLGLDREAVAVGLSGGDAPILWYDYLGGNEGSLRALVAYNHADVEGLARIFDEVVGRVLSDEVPGYCPPLLAAPAPLRFGPGGVALPPPPRDRGVAFTYDDLGTDATVVGIDLTGSESRPSGWALLEGCTVETRRLGSDDDIVEATLDVAPDLVSIDSPLSLPEGRTRVTDDDPARESAGIVREAERELRRRGVHVYPALLPSMQRLTERGIRLAERLRALGLPVIESYPGAAQDIMGIPRKQKGLDSLAEGLTRFGLTGPFAETPVSHDELDAITSAVVGAFFLSGRYEGLGKPTENDLIVPDLAPPKRCGPSRVVGFSGRSCAGKTTAACYLEGRGYAYARFSQVVEDEVVRRGLAVTKATLQQVGSELHEDPGQRWLAERVADRVEGAALAVIDGLRHPEDHAALVERYGGKFVHVFVDASTLTRRTRWIAEGREPNGFDRAEAHPVERNVGELRGLADIVVENEGTRSGYLADVLDHVHEASL